MPRRRVTIRSEVPKGPMKIIDATPDHFSQVLALNEAEIPHVSRITMQELEALAAQASYFRIVDDEGDVAGFLLALGPGEAYESLNYRWFSETYDRFVYVDRIVIAATHARRGLGGRLYEDLANTATDAPRITCEVNVRPANPNSLAFHQRLGFEEVGQQDTEGGSKRVSLLSKSLNGAVESGSA